MLAESIQRNLISGIADGTDRVALPKKGVLLLKDPLVPTVIVECGFLSNREEASRLSEEEYQKLLASCIYLGIKEHTGWKGLTDLSIVDSVTQ